MTIECTRYILKNVFIFSSGNQYVDFKYLINCFVNHLIFKMTAKPVICRFRSYFTYIMINAVNTNMNQIF